MIKKKVNWLTQKSTIGQPILDDDIMKKVDSHKWSTMRFEGLTQKDEGIEKKTNRSTE